MTPALSKRINPALKRVLGKLLFVPPIIVAAIIVMLMMQNRTDTALVDVAEVTRVLRVIELAEVDVVPRAIGYGTAQPGRIWRAVAEVPGRVVQVHPELKAGGLLPKDTVVLKIDATDYDLDIARLNAEIDKTRAASDELSLQKKNTQASLKIERDSLALAEKEYARTRKLAEDGTVSASMLEMAERTVLAQRQSVQSLASTLSLIPSQAKSLQAELSVKAAQLQLATVKRDKTTLQTPFDCRFGPVEIEKDQFLAAGRTLFEAHNLDFAEVEAQVPPGQLMHLLQTPAGLLAAEVKSGSLAIPALNMETMRKVFQIDATVRVPMGTSQATWPARFDRVRENLDARTRTIGVVFIVDEPYRHARLGIRPPPVQGTFCEVEMRAKKSVRRIVVPRSAMYGEHVYVVTNNRLQRRAVEVDITQSTYVAIRSGLQPGELLVVSDPSPAVEGMLIKSVIDQQLLSAIVDEASGKGPVR